MDDVNVRRRSKKLDDFFTSPRKSSNNANANAANGEQSRGEFEADIELAKQLSLNEGRLFSSPSAGPSRLDSRNSQAPHEPIEIADDSEDGHDHDPTKPQASPSKAMKLQENTSITEPDLYSSLTEDPLTFKVNQCPWKPADASAPYSFLAHALNELSQTKSRIAILNILTNTLRTIVQHDMDAILPAMYLLSNSLSPPYLPIELGLGGSIISKSIQHVSGLTGPAMRKLFNRTGDPGDVAFEAKSAVRTLIPHPSLTIKDVFRIMHSIANAKGQGSVKQKQMLVEKLLLSAKGEETRYIVRTLCQHIRVGATRTTVLSAISRALVLSPPQSALKSYSNSRLYAKPEFLAKVQSLPTNGKKKKDAGADPVRGAIVEMFNEAESHVKRTFVQRPNFEDLVSAVMSGPLETLQDRAPLTVGIPLHNMLGSPTRSLDEIFERLGGSDFTAEFKYDGQRAQTHAWVRGGKTAVKIFSRHLEDMTEKYPDICSLAEVLLSRGGATSFIMDAEVVAINPNTAELLTFQELSNRPRKDVKVQDVKVAVCIFAFDLLYLDGEPIIEESFRKRRQLLRTRFTPFIPNDVGVARFDHVESIESEEGREAIEEFWQRAVEGRVEGLMFKLLEAGLVMEVETSKKAGSRRKPLPATYEPDKRTSAWLKLKKDYVDGLGDSLDLIPIGAWHGLGRKAKWWSPILLGIWDASAGKIVGVCKCLSGFTDAFYTGLNERYPEGSDTCSRESLWNVETGGLRPEVYFRPQEVWEIRGADITISPVSVAALGIISPSRGLSLRFPRFISVREDKKIEDASTPEFLAGLWRSQESRGQVKGGADEGDLVDGDVSEEQIEEEGELSS